MKIGICNEYNAVHVASEITVDRQRLIYRGQVLSNENTIEHYKIGDDHTVHLVIRQVNAMSMQNNASNIPQSQNIANAAPPTPSRGPESVASSPPIQTTEVLRQSLLTLSTILSTITPLVPNISNSNAAGETILQPEFHVGQWVDVKDTANQWLEATIVSVNPSSRLMYVHYNGWPSRWDEWISWDSPRVTPFRTRTYHNASGHYSCPSLVSTVVPPPDQPATNNTASQLPVYDLQSSLLRPSTSVTSLFPLVLSHMKDTIECVERVMEENVIHPERHSEEETDDIGNVLNDLDDIPRPTEPTDNSSVDYSPGLYATVAPLFDRLGRIMIDLAPELQALGGQVRPVVVPERNIYNNMAGLPPSLAMLFQRR